MAAAFAQAFQALRGLGFREEQTRRALEDVRTRTDVANGNTEEVLRAALGALSTVHSRQAISERRA
jgi:Holliday junction resolvasome RuvABC DNA-binding subunit